MLSIKSLEYGSNFSETAIGLYYKLVENMGFNKMEALNSI